MTSNTQDHQAIRNILETALQQVEATQSQITTIKGQLQEIKSQIDLSLETIDSALKQLDSQEQSTVQMRSEVATTLSEMFEQMTRIVNGAREQMLQHRSGNQDCDTTDQAIIQEPVADITEDVVPEEEGLAEETLKVTVPVEDMPPESLTGSQVGQRATTSLNEMIATIDENNTSPATEPPSPEKTEIAEPVLQKPAELALSETKEVQGLGSADSLNESLAKARTASDEKDDVATDLPPIVDEEEDAQAVSELLKTTSGSFVAQ